MARHYLDHASTSPLRPESAEAMRAWLEPATVGDPGRIHSEGMAAREVLERSREQVAGLLGARSREVVLTSGATEAIAAAVWGAAGRGSHMVIGAVEHSAVRESAAALAASHDITEVGVDHLGRVDPDEISAALRPDTALVALQWSNHEVGTRQPVAEVAEVCADHPALLLVDAAQGVGRDPVALAGSGADLLVASAHKMGGPTGIGALCVRRGLRLDPLLVGGDQERARRAGMENVIAAVGWGVACEVLASDRREIEAAEQRRLSDRVVANLAGMGDMVIYGDDENRAPHIVCASVPGVEPQAVLLGLDRAGVAAHSGSACSSEALEPSPVLEAMGADAHRSLRISVGWNSTDADIDALFEALPRVVNELRALAGR